MSERGDKLLSCLGLMTEAEETLTNTALAANKPPEEMSDEVKRNILQAAYEYRVAVCSWLRAKGAIP